MGDEVAHRHAGSEHPLGSGVKTALLLHMGIAVEQPRRALQANARLLVHQVADLVERERPEKVRRIGMGRAVRVIRGAREGRHAHPEALVHGLHSGDATTFLAHERRLSLPSARSR